MDFVLNSIAPFFPMPPLLTCFWDSYLAILSFTATSPSTQPLPSLGASSEIVIVYGIYPAINSTAEEANSSSYM